MATLWTERPNDCKGSLPPFEDQVNLIRDRLLRSPAYLGGKIFQANVEWGSIDGEHTATLKSGTSSVVGPYVANISAVVKVSDIDFKFSSEGSLQGTNTLTDPSLMTLSLSGSAPTLEPFASDYATVTNNVKWLQARVATAYFIGKTGFRVGPPDRPRIKVHHKLFQIVPIYGPPRAQPNSLDWSTISTWPFRRKAIADSFSLLADTHRIVRPPAYDMHGYLIRPEMYRSRLVNATVELVFELTFRPLLPDQASIHPRISYSAHLLAIRTIQPPPGSTVTPREINVLHKLNPLVDIPLSTHRRTAY
ncbi:hypothetical protein BDQ17DRAFT_1325173 [Cyathus striatus]|nr:hypothetical protein BDQ17DRAFT_1325173 [Cyathus striatus]